MNSADDRNPFESSFHALLFLLLFIIFFWGLGIPPLFDLDEGAFSAASWEMLQRGDYITTWLNGELRFDKPILIYWLQSLSVSVLGVHEAAFRLPSAIAASLWMVLIYSFVRPRLGKETAIIATLMATTMMMIAVIGRAATADALLNLIIVLSLFDIYRYFETPDKKVIIYRVYFWLALGFLCKGPIAILIPLAVTFLFMLWEKRWQEGLRALFYPLGWLVFIVVAAPWYILEYQAQGQAFIDGFFLKHNVSRFSDTMEGHGGVVWYYLLVIFFILLPFSGLLITLGIKFRETIKEPLDRFLWVWFGFVFVFFSFSSTQLPHYLLYGITPLVLLLVRYTINHKESTLYRLLIWLFPLLFALILFFLPEVMILNAEANDNVYIQSMLRYGADQMTTLYRLGMGLFLLFVVGLFFYHQWRSIHALLVIGIMQVIVVTHLLIPALATAQQQPVKQAALFVSELFPEKTVVMQGLNMPSFTVYRQKITPRRTAKTGELIFSRKDRLEQLGRHKILFEQGGIVIVQKRAD